MRSILPIALLTLCGASSAQAASTAADAAAQTFECADAKQKAVISLKAKGAAGAPVTSLSVNDRAADPATLRFVNSQIGDRLVESVTSTCSQHAMDLVIAFSASATQPAGKVTINAKGTTLKVT